MWRWLQCGGAVASNTDLIPRKSDCTHGTSATDGWGGGYLVESIQWFASGHLEDLATSSCVPRHRPRGGPSVP